MAIKYTIPFKSLRSGTVYSVNIYDASYSGSPIRLKGGVQPFVTQEDDSDDFFADIRTQSGSLRIVDDGKDANGNALSADWWKSLVPLTDTDRPITVTHMIGNQTVVDWQGFMQAQNFSGELYGNPQEREFPVQCCLSVLEGMQVDVEQAELCNFAYLLKYLIGKIPTHTITNIYVQGSADAQTWLLKKIDWMNFVQTSEDADDEPLYNLYQILEDICRFWGWTARTFGQNLYLTRADDAAEQTWLVMNASNLDTMANGTAAGTTGATFSTVSLSGDEFASRNNDDYRQRGHNKATVKVEINKANDVLKFAPKTVRNTMDANGYTWVQKPNADMCGYFTTQRIASFTSRQMDGYASSYAGFYRRQLFTSADNDNAEKFDVIEVNHEYNGSVYARIQSKRPKAYSGGSLKIEGSVFLGFDQADKDYNLVRLICRVGIGMDHDSARFLYFTATGVPLGTATYTWGWTNSLNNKCELYVNGGQIQGFFSSSNNLAIKHLVTPYFPIPDGMYGYIYIDFFGMIHAFTESLPSFWLGNLTVKFTRDQTTIPATSADVRARTMEEELRTDFEYISKNNSAVNDEWNADCIYASDNNMEYGYGLILNPNGTFCQTVPYNGTDKHPEQQLADRVTAYWQQSRRKVSVEMITSAGNVSQINPQKKVTLDGTTFYPIAISRDWRDDVTELTMLELPT